MLFHDLATTSANVAQTSARNAKIGLIAQTLRAVDPGELEPAVSYLSGELRQRRTGVGWAALRELPPPAGAASLRITEVDAAFEQLASLAGAGSAARRRDLVDDLFARATAPEQRFLTALIGGEVRQGALTSLVADAVARAFDLGNAAVRRALMLRGDLGAVARVAATEGAAGVAAVGLRLGRPVHPMLAKTATSVTDALEALGTAAVEWKLDGIRIQVHKQGHDVRVFTRTLDDITSRLPEVVAAAHELGSEAVLLDGEALSLDAAGRPRPFQETAARAGTRDAEPGGTRLTPYFFDVLHRDGADLIDLPAAERAAVLAEVVPERYRVPRIVTADPEEAQAFLDDALTAGHEGIVAKSLHDPYAAGRRGACWRKVKPVRTLDLVVLAAEWGHGRRRGWLSNLHLGAREPSTGDFVMLGKTFKGLTDEMLRWQTARLLELAETTSDWQVGVRPELVVEIAFDGVQTSPRYPAGMALRFARVLRHRPDKRADEADTLDEVRRWHVP